MLDNNKSSQINSNGNAKLTEQEVQSIRTLAVQGISRRAIAERFGIARSSVSNILLGKTWGRVNVVESDN